MQKIVCKEISDKEIILSPYQEDKHFGARHLSWLNDKSLMAFSERRHHRSDEQECKKYLQYMKNNGHLLWAIEVKNSGLHIGNIAAQIDYMNQTADISILLGDRKYRGKGLGQKAWDMVVDFLEETGFVEKITAGTAVNNLSMVKILERSRLQPDGTRKKQLKISSRRVDVVFYALHP